MSGGQSAPSNTTNQVILPDFINQTAQSNLAFGQQAADRAYETNPNKALIPFNDDQLSAYAAFEQMAGATNPYFDQAVAHTQRLLPSGPRTAEGLNADTQALLNPYSDLVIDPSLQLMRTELDKSLNAERARASASGSFGGSRLGVLEGTAEAEQALRAGQLRGGLLTQGYEAAAGRAASMEDTNLRAGMEAIQLLPQLGVGRQQQNRTDLATLEYIGKARQQQDQAYQDFLATNWQEARDYPIYQQQIREQNLQSTPYGSTQVTTGMPGGQSRNVAGGVLGGAASGAAIGAQLSAGNPYGVAAGAAVGGLLGAFG